MSGQPAEIACSWLSAFAAAISSGSAKAVASMCFLPHGWLRDVLTFTWDTRSLSGTERIAAYLESTLKPAKITEVQLDARPGLEPAFFPLSSDLRGVLFAFTFQTPVAHGRGLSRLLVDEITGDWKALSVFMMIDDLKGHEEVVLESGLYGGHTLSWQEVNSERRAVIESNPLVVVVGAGQTGLHMASRFKQMKIPTLVLERNAVVGDVWRKRYPTLTLHTPRSHHSLLYQPYPSNWPFFTPRDKLANWLEQYAENQDLVVWTKSYICVTPEYDTEQRKWNITVDKDGTQVTLHPDHIVLATGTQGDPIIPTIASMATFHGETLHASKYMGGHPYVGKRTVVIGAGNTAADMCQDLAFRGAASVTMVQRSSTCVVSDKYIGAELERAWPDGVPVEISDFKVASMPLGLLKAINKTHLNDWLDADKELHEGLRRAGLKLNNGPDDSGQLLLVFERGGGYWLDVGVAKLISSGQVKVKQGVEIERFRETKIIFTDGSELEADVVIFATGYENMRETMRRLFGSDIIDRTHTVWGVDEEGELRGCYRPSGHPGLWYAAGDFYNSRFFSKQLAIQIKALQLNLIPSHE